MKQRLHLARGLMGDARVLFLDEPTTGMDPLAAREFRTLIGELKGEGRTILLTTHDMVEAETVCDRVTLIDRGRILATETPRTLGSLISRFQRIDVDGAPDGLIEEIELITGVSAVAGSPTGQYGSRSTRTARRPSCSSGSSMPASRRSRRRFRASKRSMSR